VTTDGAALYVGTYQTDDTTTSDDLAEEETRVRNDALTELQVTPTKPLAVTGNHIIGVSGRAYRAILPGQNGSTAVEGDIFGIATDLGFGYTITDMTQQGSYDAHSSDFTAIAQSLVDSVGSK
jgi:hypothetical protein